MLQVANTIYTRFADPVSCFDIPLFFGCVIFVLSMLEILLEMAIEMVQDLEDAADPQLRDNGDA